MGAGLHGAAIPPLSRQLGGAGGFSFSDDFNRADGAIGNGWEGATWTISGNKVINTPSLGAELIVNGGFDADSDWTKGANWTIAAGLASKSGGVANDLSQAVLTLGAWYRAIATHSAHGAGNFNLMFGSNMVIGPLITTNATFTNSGNASATLAGLKSNTAGSGNWDNISYKALVLSELFAIKDFARADVDVSVKATIVSGNRCGLVLNLDSASSPANFVIATHDGVTAKLVKSVAGVYTDLISAAATYSAGAVLRAVKSGTTYKLYYNSVQIGADQSVADSSLINNTLAGIFNTYELNSLDDFSIVAV